MSPFIWILGSTLLHFLWQGAIIGAVSAAAVRAGNRRSAQWRYMICMLALCACLLAPVITGVLLAWSVYGAAHAETQAALAPALQAVEAPVIFIPDQTGFFGLSQRAATFVVAAWLAGVICLGVRYIFEWQRVIRMRVSAAPLMNPPLLAEIASQVLRTWRLSGRVRAAVSHMTTTPLVVGWWRPLIIFPAALITRMPPREFELVLLHEVAHILRRDTWMNALQLLVKIALFYHPAVHWLCARARIERECACDDFVIAHSGSTYEYARMLVSLAPREVTSSALAVGATTGADLVPRLRYLAGECVEDEGVQHRNAPFALIAVLMACAVWTVSQRAGGLNFESVMPSPPRLLLEGPAPMSLPPAETPAHGFAAFRSGNAESPAEPPTTTSTPTVLQSVPDSDVIVAPTDQIVIPSQDLVAPAEPPAIAPGGSALNPAFSPLPEYPPRARVDGIEGSVEVMLRIAPDGRATGLKILNARPAGVFEGATRRALMRWRFEPGGALANDGATATYELTFSLDGVSTRASAPPCPNATASLTCRGF